MLSFKISRLNTFQSYLFGNIVHHGTEYLLNIQAQRRSKVLKLSFGMVPVRPKVIVRLTGPDDGVVEDCLPYYGESERLEVDSDEITYCLAGRQDRFVLEVVDD